MVFASTVPVRPRQDDEPFLVGYVRVSTDGQDNQRQVDELVKAGVDPRDIWGDEASGKDLDRVGWQAMMRDIRAGDILVVHTLDRISRNVLDTLTVFRDLHERGVKVRVLTMGLDTATPVGRFTLTMMAAHAQMEREMALVRTMSGLQRARERGAILGSVKKFPDTAVKEAYEIEGTIEKARLRLGCSRITVIRALNRLKAAEEAKKPEKEQGE